MISGFAAWVRCSLVHLHRHLPWPMIVGSTLRLHAVVHELKPVERDTAVEGIALQLVDPTSRRRQHLWPRSASRRDRLGSGGGFEGTGVGGPRDEAAVGHSHEPLATGHARRSERPGQVDVRSTLVDDGLVDRQTEGE